MSLELFRFWVPGLPTPQGSKNAYVVGKRAMVTDQNAETLAPWRQLVAIGAQQAYAGDQLDGPVIVNIEFRFVRPKSVKREYPTVKPDLDKLVRAILDALTISQIWRDDSLVVDMRVSKRYADQPGALVRVGIHPTTEKRRK